ncbi:MAG: hypothetical protein ABFR19_08645 [Pseudomonadota bacterium]
MNALSNKENVRRHRLRKKAGAFSAEYMECVDVASPGDFINAKLEEASIKIRGTVTVFADDMIHLFYDFLNEYEDENGRYSLPNLVEAWQKAEVEDASGRFAAVEGLTEQIDESLALEEEMQAAGIEIDFIKADVDE